MRGSCCAAGAVLVFAGMQYGLPLAVAAAGSCALAAVVLRPRPEALLPQLIFGAGLLHGLYCQLFEAPLQPQGFRGLALLAVLCASAYLCLHLRASLQRARFWALLAIFAAMGAAVVRASPEPRWLSLLAMLAAAWAIGRAEVTGELAAAALLYQGRAFSVLDQAFPGPLALACAAVALLALPRVSGRWPAAAGAAWLAFVFFAGRPLDEAWLGGGLLCAAAAAFSRDADQPRTRQTSDPATLRGPRLWSR